MESIKTYKAILLSVFVLVIVVSGSYLYMRDKPKAVQSAVKKSSLHVVTGQVTRMHEGENKLVYSLDIPETATTSLSMDDALLTIQQDGQLYAAIYMTYEGARGYSSLDYINGIIGRVVPSLTVTGTTTLGSTIWTVAESTHSEWHVGQVGDGQWLMVVESKKVQHDQIVDMLENITTE